MSGKPLALEAYETLAEAYAAHIDIKPHNAFYERPATLSLLPEVSGKRVLDAGCGPGVYAEWLLKRGAEVFAVDASPKMVELARRRLGAAATVRLADLERPLSFLESESFDLVLCPLVLAYIEDWSRPLVEFHRLLIPSGQLVISVTHPLFDYLYYESQSYFETELVSCEWRGFTPVRVRMPSYRRSLAATFNPLIEAGFRLEKVLEPRPTAEFKAADPKEYEELSRRPAFLCLSARK